MKKIILLVIYSFFLLIPLNIHAKSVTCSNGTFDAEINITNDIFSIGQTSNIEINSNYEYEVDYKIEDKKIIALENNSIIKAILEGTTSLKTSITFFEDGEEAGSCEANISIKVVSNDSSLKKLNLEEIDISALFIPDKYEYEFKIPYKFDKINILAEANNSNAKIIGDGRRYLNEGVNEYDIVVTATDGTTSTYKITFIRESANDDITLKSLIIEGYEITPNFNKEIYEYSLNVDKTVDDIMIKAEPTYEFAKIKGTGKFILASGLNTYKVTVIAENGNEQDYIIKINKNNGSSKLKKLEIENYDIDFNNEIYTYNLTIKNDVNSLNIIAEAFENEQIEIIGNDDLKVGNNEIIIRVTSSDKTTTTYKINVNKLSIDEVKQLQKNNILLNILLVIFIISIAIMGILIFIFIKRNYKFKKKYKTLQKRIKNKKK